MRSCVVIPTYNESENIDDIVGKLLVHENLDILVVDDSSPDGTGDLVLAWSEKTGGRVSLLTRTKKEGLGRAYLDGFAHAVNRGYDVIAQMDADLSHDPAVINTLIEPVLFGDADLVLGSRYIDGGSIPEWSWHRRFLSRGGNAYARFILGLKVHDATGGYRAYDSRLLKELLTYDVRADGYGFQIEMAYMSTRLGATIREVPISFHDRIRGLSKMSFRIVIEALALVSLWAVRDRILRRPKIQMRHELSAMADTTHGKKESGLSSSDNNQGS